MSIFDEAQREHDEWVMEMRMDARSKDALKNRAFLRTMPFTPVQSAVYDARVLGIERRFKTLMETRHD